MKACLTTRAPSTGSFFTHSSVEALTKAALISETRSLLSQSGFTACNYAGHSYRIGAATTVASVDIPPWLIKTMGRWSSACYERHIKIPHSVLSEVSRTLTRHINQ